jgi:tetratricopeptide (TPR) repeat protein
LSMKALQHPTGTRILLALLLWMMAGPPAPCNLAAGAETDFSLVPREAWITDFEARLAVARLLAYRDDQLAESAFQYGVLLSERPHDPRVPLEYAEVLVRMRDDEGAIGSLQSLLEQDPGHPVALTALARVYVRQEDYERAAGLMHRLIRLDPRSPDLLMEMADLEAALGHAKNCRDLYQRALSHAQDPEEMSLRLADRMNLWGDFYRSEALYRAFLARHPNDPAVLLKLARLLVSSQRYEEAEGLYRGLLAIESSEGEALLGLARLKLMEKDFEASLHLVERSLERNPESPEGLLLQGEVLFQAGRLSDALRVFRHLIEKDRLRGEALKGLGKAHLGANEEKQAREAFEAAARIRPRDVEVLYHLAGKRETPSREFLDSLSREPPMRLVEWGRTYALYGHNRAAITCFERCLQQDPECFPARMALAEMLGVDHQYERAIEAFRELGREFPDNSKILISQARVLGWSKRYDESVALYEKVHELNPADPLPRIEAARTAVWGKSMERAQSLYRATWETPVDSRILTSLPRMTMPAEKGEGWLRRVRDACEDEVPFNGYELLAESLSALRPRLSPEDAHQMEKMLADFLPQYRIQKSAFLESEAKLQVWNKRFATSMKTYEELMEFRPGNEEALFDYAQGQCALGLCDGEGKAYAKLLGMDPLHSLAGTGLESQGRRTRPSLGLNHSLWEEEGRGELSQIVRHRTDATVEFPLLCQYHLKFVGHRWVEDPKQRGDEREAYGGSIEAEGVLSPAIRAALGYTRKDYRDPALQDKNLGHGRLWINLQDYAQLGLGYERADELYNEFGIRQGVQSDQWWVGMSSQLTRQLEVKAEGRAIRYTDDNDGSWFTLKAGYAFTDHPGIFKITAAGEYRDTKHGNIYHYRGAELADITHPYWTPEDYYGATLTVEWYHDLSSLFMCGSELHFYDIRFSFGTDSEQNPAVRLEAEWHYEFQNRWTVSLKGLIHRSEEWDANGLSLNIQYRF